MKTLIGVFFVLSGVNALADHKMPKVTMPKEFDTLKTLVGTWEGTMLENGKEVPAKVTYELTSGGTALTEKLDPGGPHEMTSVYHKDGKSVGMTHYCMLGNSPQMKLKKADAKTLAFEMDKTAGISSPKEMHMHAVTLTLLDGNTLKQEWVSFADGKKQGETTMTFKRKN